MEVMFVSKQELKEIMDESINNILSQFMESQKPKEIQTSSLIYGIKGLANFLGVTQPTAQKWKKEGVFPYVQRGRTIIFKPDEVLAGMAKRKKRV